ncbi:MAG: TetR/AcrR family transcriptional regulator [Rhodospirillales bacterium]|nr:TetR/AcrR family transcriptional regulator [Rhodospirillales bacterium]
MAKSTYHHGNLHDALINAAEDLLDSAGHEGLSLRGLARKAGVSQTAPYRHFADKDALLIKVATRGFMDFTEALQKAVDAAAAQPPRDQLAALGRAYIDFSQQRSGVFHLMFLSDLLPKCADREMVEAATASFQVLARVVANCQGKADPLPSDATVVASWAMMHGLAMLLTHDVIHNKMTGNLSRAQIIDAITRMLLVTPPAG